MAMQKRHPMSNKPSRKLGSDVLFTSVARLTKIQKLLQDTGTDGFLCIQGIDSRYNEGMQECVNYLLFGSLEASRRDLISAGYDDDIIDDLIICIKPDGVEVYCNPMNYDLIISYVAGWHDIRIHCLTLQEYQADDDMTEEFKINCFVSMVTKCNRVAVPFFSMHQGAGASFDKMKMEQWPIIQAYALEGYGSGTFFTLKHDVTDLSAAVFDIYETFDVMSTEKFLCEQLPVFERQWEGLERTVDVARMSDFEKGFTETNAGESLVTYFTHGRVGTHHNHTEEDNNLLWQRPFVYMGQNTKCLTSLGKGPPVSKTAELITAGVAGRPALHMVCHGVAPKSGLMCTRTYFFDTSALPPVIGNEEEYRNADTEQLSKAYRVAVEVTLRSISEYSATLSPNQVISNAKENVIKGLQKSMDCRKLDIQAKLEIRMHNGKHTELKEGQTPKCIINMSVVIANIHSASQQDVVLGAVAYSDSFLLSTINFESSGDSLLNSETLNLTQNISRWSVWNTSAGCSKLTEQTKQLIDNREAKTDFSNISGEMLIDGQSVEIVSSQSWLQPITANLYLYEHSVVILTNSLGPISLAKSDIKSASFYDGGGPSVPAFLILFTTMDFQTKLPTQLHNTMRMVVISFSPRSKAYKQFFEQVFQAWKSSEDGGFILKMEESLPESLVSVHEAVTAKFKSQTSGSLSSRPMSSRISNTQAASKLTGLTRFISHISISACLSPDQKISSSELPALLQCPAEGSVLQTQEEDKSEVMLTISILSGIPGSYKQNVANFITKLTQERSRWVIHKQTSETSHEFDAGKLENTLSYVYGVLKKKANATSKASRMLIITPGFTDIQTVVQTIQRHPNKELRQHVRIGSITTCIDPHNTFLTGYMTLPGILNQCTPGWVNNVVLTSSSDHGNGNLKRTQDLVRSVNPAVNFIITDRGELTRSQDIELILADTAFSKLELVKARILMSRPARTSASSYGMNTVILRFTQPLIKQKLMIKLREFSRISVSEAESCVLYTCGRSKFVGNDELFDISYASVSNMTKTTAVQMKPGEAVSACFMSFTGFSLQESMLKDVLRGCVDSKPEKQELVTIKSMDRLTKKKIHKEKHLEPLPAGWFYNGSQYIDMSGERSDTHPDIEKFLHEYVDKKNQVIKEYNQKIDQIEHHDLFE